MAQINLQGDTSGSISISAPSVAGSNTLTLPATTQTLATQNALGVRNLIINGDMRIAQRGTSATGKTSTGYYTVDRWSNSISSAGTWTISQDTDVPTGQGFANSHKLTCTTADSSLGTTDFLAIQTKFEGQNLQHLKKGTSSAEKLTLSFWVKSNKTGTYIAEIYDNDNTRQISKSYTINATDTWEKKTITYEGDTTGTLDNDNALSLDITMWIGAGTAFTTGTNGEWKSASNANRAAGLTVNLADSTSNYINITGVQLEVGDTATPFEHRPYDMELARCQRYCAKLMGNQLYETVPSTFIAYSTTKSQGTVNTPVTMRSTPTYTANSLMYTDVFAINNAISASSIITNTSGNRSVWLDITTTGATAGRSGMIKANNSLSSYIILDAEL